MQCSNPKCQKDAEWYFEGVPLVKSDGILRYKRLKPLLFCNKCLYQVFDDEDGFEYDSDAVDLTIDTWGGGPLGTAVIIEEGDMNEM